MYILACKELYSSLSPHAAGGSDDEDEDACGTTCIIIVVVVGVGCLVLGALLGFLAGCILHKLLRKDGKYSDGTELAVKSKQLY